MFELTFIWRKVCIRIVLKSSLDFFFAQTKKINNFPTIVNGVFNMIDHFKSYMPFQEFYIPHRHLILLARERSKFSQK
ncbi:hypothetical protein M23134_05581 [Microscilla marina ATCC 23134]|uniref:Uncharacterized protein n=1 Tax=Microscilla marina ATCC 23134 TaxID=313606 RepID=A1ZI41_MICM2|nr:hypothetical protein M23134_05581 [Microscilla marina ATCC 23134]